MDPFVVSLWDLNLPNFQDQSSAPTELSRDDDWLR
jgi:hypothetical protein